MAVLFTPNTRHERCPDDTELQLALLPAALAAAPVVIAPGTRSVAEYVRSHCTLAGWVPPLAFKETLSVTFAPGAPEPLPKEIEGVWAAA